MKHSKSLNLYLGLLRIALGFIFLWAFFDKLFGLGFATKADKSWLMGVSPTYGFLKMGLHGTFATVFQSLAGNPIVDWLFMLGLLGIGVALIVGAGVRIAAISGSIMVLLMWLAEFPSANNPLLDEHVIYFFVFLVLSSTDVTQQMGLGAWWQRLPLVKNNPILK